MGRKRMAADIPLGAVQAKAMYLKDNRDAALSHLLTVLEKDLVKLHWRTKAGRVLSNTKTDEERQRAESDELHKWQAGLTEIVDRGGLPIVAQASTAADPAGALVGAAGTLRAKILRTRVRAWWKVREWVFSDWNVAPKVTRYHARLFGRPLSTAVPSF